MTVSRSLNDQVKQATVWESHTIHTLRVQRNVSVFFSVGLFIGLLVTSLSLSKVATDNKKVPIPIIVDRSTGEVYVDTQLNEVMTLDDKDAVVENLLTSFVIAWKTYEYSDASDRAKKVALLSNRKVYKEYKEQFQFSDERNPNVYYAKNDKARVEIRSVSKLNDETYQIYFRLLEKRGARAREYEKNFFAILKFTLAGNDMQQQDRWFNPLGLLVTSQRFDEVYTGK
ncbi:VirB8/TrbF family protein [Marinicella sp. W31]|uniref:VirB8/TrbF family protein n=1 Tax=Marinicella sp. W31 TaxID=3023713 RepID=UPI0037580E5F